MDALISRLRADYPRFSFTAGELASWSPHLQQITYRNDEGDEAIWSLFHELGHALLDHNTYNSDLELLQKEAAAWEKAKSIGVGYKLEIHPDHIQDCLDTYRDWLHRRSTCPACNAHGLQTSQRLYQCPNCRNTWKVSSARFCRPYRLKMAQKAM